MTGIGTLTVTFEAVTFATLALDGSGTLTAETSQQFTPSASPVERTRTVADENRRLRIASEPRKATITGSHRNYLVTAEPRQKAVT